MTFCVWLDEVDETDPRIGGKARSLRRLAAAGLPVPRAFAISTALFEALRAGGPPLPAALDGAGALAALDEARAALDAAPLPAGFARELADALARLAPGPDARFSVRSSAPMEDRADALAAGIFFSRTDVAARDVPAAARAVLAAAIAPAAIAYAARSGARDAPAIAVLVHRFSSGDASGTAAFDPEGDTEPRVEPGARSALAPAARARLVAGVRALAARGGASEVEWVSTGPEVTFLQLRPYRATARAQPWRWAEALVDGAWLWDAAHNPLPLSPAHAGLVAFVDAHCRTPFRQRVVGGYLFGRASEATSAPPADAGEALRQLSRATELALASLPPDASLEAALRVFAAVYEPLFSLVQPAARAAREALASFLRAQGSAVEVAELLRGVPSIATVRARAAEAIAAADSAGEKDAAVAAYVATFGDEAPAWDVAAPTYGEDPAPLRAIAPRAAHALPTEGGRDAAARLDASLDGPARAEGRTLLSAARTAAAVAEDDDALYARAQTVVRRALLREGRRLQSSNALARVEDIFWLPLDLVRADARGEAPLSPAAVTHEIATARRAHVEALAAPPPLPGALLRDVARTGTIRGRPASGGRAVGRVHLHEPGARAPVPAGAVLVARSLLPTELPLLSPAALVVETGGPLGHVAAQARERALPAVVDVPGATTAFRAGDLVLVDGDAGLAIRLAD